MQSSRLRSFRIRISDQSFTTVDSLILVWTRIAVAVAVYVWADGFLSDDKYRLIFVDARMQFKYGFFEWIRMWPGEGIRWHFVICKFAAVGLAVGLMTRVSAAVVCVSMAYVLLVDCQIYVNHYYLLSMTAGLLVFLPAGQRCSIDAWLGWQRRRPSIWRWQLWLLRFQMGMPYFFGAIAKLNGDWFRGQPADLILRSQTTAAGKSLAELPGAVDMLVWGGFAYDLLVVPMLLWRPTRPIAIAFSFAFHLTNAMTLSIGVFPWFMLATLIVFFPPGTLDRRIRLFLGGRGGLAPHNVGQTPAERKNVGQDPSWQTKISRTGPGLRVQRIDRVAFYVAIAYVSLHSILPFRPAVFPGDSNWNERGHRFAWRMMLRHKVALTHFLVVDANSDAFLFVPSTIVLNPYQSRRADHHPELIRQTAVAISKAAADFGVAENRVYALALVSLNGRRPKPMVDPTVDLLTVRRGWWADDWVDDDPGPLLDPPWMVPKERWWTELELPEPFQALQGRTPAELESYLKEIAQQS